MQTMDEKIEAIKSLLPLIWDHSWLHNSMKLTQRYGDLEGIVAPDGSPPPIPEPICDGHCFECYQRCKGEAWERYFKWLRYAYRVKDIQDALAQVYQEWPYMGLAINWRYVDFWDDGAAKAEAIAPDERARRQRYADKGVELMAQRLKGEIVPFRYAIYSFIQTPVYQVKGEDIRRLRMEGKSYNDISKALHISKRDVRRALKGERHEVRV